MGGKRKTAMEILKEIQAAGDVGIYTAQFGTVQLNDLLRYDLITVSGTGIRSICMITEKGKETIETMLAITA